MDKYELCIIGAGPGGYETAADAGARGIKTVLIEERDLGGTCLNRGCIPTKTLIHTSEMVGGIKKQAGRIGITGTDGVDVDMKGLLGRKNEVIAELRNGIAQSMKKNKVTVIQGHAALVDNKTIRVTPGDGAASYEIEAENTIVATGSVPFVPPVAGADSEGVYTSDELLENDKKLSSLIIVGGGVIGLEFACVYAGLGARIIIVEALGRLLASADREISQSIKLQMKKLGVEVYTSSKVTGIEGRGGAMTGGLAVTFDEKGTEKTVRGDIVLMAVGRKPNTTGLIAGDASDAVKGLEMHGGFITVDKDYMTSTENIYAIGDVIGGIQLAHVATAEGRCALAAITGEECSIDMATVPSVVYTQPEISTVGLSADEANERGFDAVVTKYPMGANGKTVLSLGDRGFVKIVSDAESRRILGAQLMCMRSSDMISQLAMAITAGMTTDDIKKTIFPHPSFAEALGEAVRAVK